MSVASRIIHSDYSPNCQKVPNIIGRHVLHHSMVRTQFVEKFKHDTLDTLIAVGSYYPDHNHVELFTLSNSTWQIKNDYPHSKDISRYSILAIGRKFIVFGGWCQQRKVLTNQDIKKYENI